MDTTKIVVILGAVILLGGVGWFLSANQSEDSVMMKDEAVMEKDSKMEAEGEAMMEKKDEVMTEKKDGVMMEEEGKMESGVMMQKGSYEAYAPEKLAKAKEGDVVLFFRASWCPTCRTLDADIKANSEAIPSDVTILDVNYDDSTALKQKYGVTYQHTLVQVDTEGNLIRKWTKSPTLASLVAEIR